MKLYILEQAPNGTHNLLIADEDHQIVDSVSEAVFGMSFDPYDALGGLSALVEGEDIFYYTREQAENDPYIGDCVDPVTEVSLEDVLKHVAVSPMSNGSELINKLKEHGFEIKKSA